ncbi:MULTISPECIES: Arc family DNA-binding protein [Cronobacter]|uniref:Arc family DNA-binding protein n=1 Tax=Cronobacter TaxID=413496 RepID=UPI000BE892F2|nr:MULTISPECIES: Arc family DNA-binding protein [Cronobacter]EGT4313444.1 Arc family DNA-binding protein [Cronobacter malonaticus]NCH48158.1 Arc family DNA-binding protein [Cronobacter malonaticus]PQV86523.1 Arc family DNA-binding protein [Cronobacter sakazakii]
MSREDPQLRIRLPIELKTKVEESAKTNGRSMNAEIVQRLEVSYLGDIPDDAVLSAKDAFVIANNAKEELSNVIFRRTFAEINSKIRMGHKSFSVDLNDLELEILNDDDYYAVLDRTLNKLRSLGYEIPEKSMDCGGFLVNIPEDIEGNKK